MLTRSLLARAARGAAVVLLAAACSTRTSGSGGDHEAHIAPEPSAGAPPARGAVAAQAGRGLPPSAEDAAARLATSPRHGEWAVVRTGPADSVRAWVVYPERSTKAPVVVVVHEIYGLTEWIRGVADQLAADGYIAIAPDLLTMSLGRFDPGDPPREAAVAAIRTLQPDDVQRQLDAVARYGMALPAALPRYGVVGFCWGGSTVFAHAVHAPTLGAAVVYYGASPPAPSLATVRAPVLGLYGGNDARVNASIPSADSALRAMGKTYVHTIFPGAGHGFLRQQQDSTGANLAATREAWPRTLAFFRQHLGA